MEEVIAWLLLTLSPPFSEHSNGQDAFPLTANAAVSLCELTHAACSCLGIRNKQRSLQIPPPPRCNYCSGAAARISCNRRCHRAIRDCPWPVGRTNAPPPSVRGLSDGLSPLIFASVCRPRMSVSRREELAVGPPLPSWTHTDKQTAAAECGVQTDGRTWTGERRQRRRRIAIIRHERRGAR